MKIIYGTQTLPRCVVGVPLRRVSFTRKDKMIEALVKPIPLDNDIAVVKILQLMGQLSLKDVKYVLDVATKVYDAAIIAEQE